jgi:hypothetical protein
MFFTIGGRLYSTALFWIERKQSGFELGDAFGLIARVLQLRTQHAVIAPHLVETVDERETTAGTNVFAGAFAQTTVFAEFTHFFELAIDCRADGNLGVSG